MPLNPFPWKNKGESSPTKLNRQNLNAAEEAFAAQIGNGEVALPVSVVSSSRSEGLAKVPGMPWVINVRDYGATGNGTTDDTAAIAAAIEALSSGGRLHFPTGNYRTSPITITKLVRMTGDGQQKSLLTPVAGSTGTLLSITTGSAQLGVELFGIHINLSAFPAMNGILINNLASGSVVSDVRVSKGTVGLMITNCNAVAFRDLSFADQTEAAIQDFGDGGLEHYFTNVQINASSATMASGFELIRTTATDKGGIYFDYVEVTQTGGSITYAYNLHSSAGGLGTPIFLFGNQMVADNIGGTAALRLSGVEQVQIVNSWFTNPEPSTKPAIIIDKCNHVYVASVYCVGGVSFNNSTVSDCAFSSVAFSGCVAFTIGTATVSQLAYGMVNLVNGATLTDSQANLALATSTSNAFYSTPQILVPTGSIINVNGGGGGSSESSYIRFNTRAQFGYNGSAAAVYASDNGQSKPFSVNLGGAERLHVDFSSGYVAVPTVGGGLRVKEGSNAKQGVSGAMVAGEVTVANTAITASSRLLLTRQAGGTNPGAVYELTRTAGTSFIVKSTNASDTGTVAYQIFEPA